MPAAIFARLKAVPRPFRVHERPRVLVRIVVERFGMLVSTALKRS
jgi:hypothetical protein